MNISIFSPRTIQSVISFSSFILLLISWLKNLNSSSLFAKTFLTQFI